jgi:hypothetical protein
VADIEPAGNLRGGKTGQMFPLAQLGELLQSHSVESVFFACHIACKISVPTKVKNFLHIFPDERLFFDFL